MKGKDQKENVKRAEDYISSMINTMMSISAVLATISVAILAIIARLPYNLINLAITFFVSISAIIFISSFIRGRRSHGTIILSLLKGEEDASEKARLPLLKYVRLLN